MVSKLPPWVWLGGSLLTFTAGMINAIAFLGFSRQGVTHVTGTFSHLSIALLEMDGPRIRQMFFMIFAFFIGAVLSGIIIRDGHLKMGRRYGFALAVESILLFIASYGFWKLSTWGDYCAGMAAGLQNALASAYSGAVLRTTHLTGVLTDLGVLVGHWIQGMKVDGRRIKLFLIMIASFVGGGIFGSYFYHLWSNVAMLIPAFLIGGASIGYILILKFSVPKKLPSLFS